jgi:Ala-tRNA(Pro) deacylase
MPNAHPSGPSAHQRLLTLLEQGNVAFRLIEHAPEGQTVRASELRGHPLAAAAKCMVLALPEKASKTAPSHVLAVVPGDRRVDLRKVGRVYGVGKARFADLATAEELGRTVSGTITPFALHPTLRVLADPALFEEPELYFNAARLDRSLAIRAEDYRRLADPDIVPITVTPSSR